jgi:hypothetical protein
MTKRLRPGCPVFTQAQGGNFASKGILWSTRKGVTWLPWSKEPKTEYSHVACVLHGSNKDIRNTMLVEMTWPEMRIVPLSYYLDQGCKVEIYEPRYLPSVIMKAIAQKLASYVGKRYGKWKIGLFFIDAMLGKLISLCYVLPIYLFSGGKIKLKGIEFALFSRLDITGALVCSQSVAKPFWQLADMHFGQKGYLSCNPDNMHDYISKSLLWKKMFDTEWFKPWHIEFGHKPKDISEKEQIVLGYDGLIISVKAINSDHSLLCFVYRFANGFEYADTQPFKDEYKFIIDYDGKETISIAIK